MLAGLAFKGFPKGFKNVKIAKSIKVQIFKV